MPVYHQRFALELEKHTWIFSNAPISPEHHFFAQLLLPLNLGKQQFFPVVGTVDVAGPQLHRQTVPIPLEEQKRVTAGGFEVAVVRAVLVPAVDRDLGRVHVQHHPSLKVNFQGSRVTSDGGLILVRELDERLGFSQLIDRRVVNRRHGKNTQFALADLLRQSVYSRLAGYEDVNDAERIEQDPTFRLIGSERTWERGAALHEGPTYSSTT